MTTITDEYMRQMLQTVRPYVVVILKEGPQWGKIEQQPIIWEHARNNFRLRADGLLPVVCPVSDGSEVKGVGIFNGDVDTVTAVMEEDPGVRAGIFVYEVHQTRSFPGDSLP